jgi:hypothetical protein
MFLENNKTMSISAVEYRRFVITNINLVKEFEDKGSLLYLPRTMSWEWLSYNERKQNFS